MTITAESSAICARWRKLFALIPGYDPRDQADGYIFDESEAERATRFFPTVLRHVKGPLHGQPFELQPWQEALIGCLFGWHDSETGYRRYNECMLYVASKNGKSAMAAGILLYMMTALDERGAELYSAASSREQGAFIYSHAVGFVKQSPALRKRLKIYGDKGGAVQKSITYEEHMSAYRVLTADANTADGSFPFCSMIDELHRHKTPEMAELLHKKSAAHPEPLTMYVTTADHNRESICNTMLRRAIQVRDNKGDRDQPGYNPRFLPILFQAHKEDDITDPATWRKANPNLGVIIPESYFAQEVRTAMETPSMLNSFLRLHLNIVTDADVAWLDIDTWDACAGALGELDGRECYAGLDLAATTDIAALVLYFQGDGDEPNSVLPFFWVPKANARKRQDKDRVPYMQWIADGYIEATEGNVIDYDVIRQRIIALGEQYRIREIAIDRWNSTQLQTQLQGDGFEIVPFGQGFASLSAPTKELERLILEKNIRHAGHPVLRWMAGNVMAETDAAGNVKPSKKKSTEKIDGIVALIMALGRAMVAEPEEQARITVLY